MEKTDKTELKNLIKFILIVVLVVGMIITVSVIMLNIEKARNNKIETKRYNILTTTQVGYDMVKNIVGDKSDVYLLTRDKETFGKSYECSVKNLREIRKADIIVYCGDEAEPWMKDVFKKDINIEDKIMINMFLNIEPVTINNSENLVNYITENNVDLDLTIIQKNYKKDNMNTIKDYTCWNNPENGKIMIDNIYERLSAHSGNNINDYYNNYINYTNTLNDIINSYNKVKKNIMGNTIVCAVKDISPYYINYFDFEYLNKYNYGEKNLTNNIAFNNYIRMCDNVVIVDSDNELSNIVNKEYLYLYSNMTTHTKDFSYLDSLEENLVPLK